MSEISAGETKVAAWLDPMGDPDSPCGPDLEYDNDFLALTQAAAGKPESQFGDAEPPDWRSVTDLAEAMFDRTRDLRVAVLWTRAMLHLHGVTALSVGLSLINGLVDGQWDHVHPLPDPDDGDPYARVNTLTVLSETEGLVGDLRTAWVINDRAVGQLNGRAFELSWTLAPAGTDEPVMSKEHIAQMMAAAVAKTPELRPQVDAAIEQLERLAALVTDKLGRDLAPDFRVLKAMLSAVQSALPAVQLLEAEGGEDADGAEGGAASGGGAGPRKGLSGTVASREDALRAIDMVCEYLERAEPTNPAPLFLRRARQLLNHNFLQLMKVLAPDALASVASLVGIDPDNVQPPEGA
jgi:type VI secretion system protein ImpA